MTAVSAPGGAEMSPPCNLAAALESRATRAGWHDRVAFVTGDRHFTHGEVHGGAARLASLLAGLGAGRGTPVLIALPDGVELAWAFLGAVRLGAVAVPVNPRLTVDDHRHLTGDADPAVVVCSNEIADRFPGRTVVEAEALEAALPGHPPAPVVDVRADEGAYAQYTSGTTGLPKGALHAHRDPLVYFDAYARVAPAIDVDDVVLSVSKLYFAYGLGNSLFFPLLAGCRSVLHPGHPRPDEIAALARRHRVTVLFGVPTFYAHLVAAGEAEAFTTLRVAVSAGEPLTPVLAERTRAFLGCPILEGIGSTEVGQTFASNTLSRWRDGTVGQALPPYRVGVRDDLGREVAPGNVGALWVSGPTVMIEYLGQPAATAAVRRGDWLCTGDRAELDGEGFLRMHGRADDIELVGGISVAPLEIEAVLSRHPALTEVAVAGVVGPDGASRLVAFGVTSPGAPPEEMVAAELVSLARAELAPFKVPHRCVFVDALPRTPTGKLRRFVLRAGGMGA